MQTTETQLFIISAETLVAGIRMDQILSFVYNESELSLSIRYLGNAISETFQGKMAQAILRELRYAGRK